jgi:hypothetical protein
MTHTIHQPLVVPKRSKAGFIWAAAIFVVTSAIGIGLVIGSFFVLASSISGFKAIDAGETSKVQLGTGEWYVFGGASSTFGMGQITIDITDPSGAQVTPNTSAATYSADDNGMKYESFGSFDVKTAGIYTVSVDGPAGTTARIGQISLLSFIGMLVGGIAIGALGFVVALIVLIVTLVRRSRSKRTMAPPMRSGPPPAPPAPPAVTAVPMASPPPPAPPAPMSPPPPGN